MNGSKEAGFEASTPPPTESVDAPRVRARGYWIVALIASLLFVVISWMPSEGLAKYRYSFASLVPLIWTVYALRHRLLLLRSHFALFAIALLLHDLGAFGGYQRRVAGLQYDWWVHFYFGVVGGLIVARLASSKLGLRGLALALLTILVITGIGGIHEIVEAATTVVLGKDYGMLVVGGDNPLDTQEDLLNNVLGSSLGVAIHAASARAALARASRTASPSI